MFLYITSYFPIFVNYNNVGICNVDIPWPVTKIKIKLRMKNASKEIIKPTIAATIVDRAESTFPLSPPEEIQRIPPKIRKNNEAIIAIISIICTTAPTTPPAFCGLRLQRPLN